MTSRDALFEKMQGIAARGERCPFNEALPTGGLSDLARAGRIRIEVFRHNWRVVTILTGQYAGKQTMRDPALLPDAKPYVVIDATTPTRRYNIPLAERQEPWKPGDPKPQVKS